MYLPPSRTTAPNFFPGSCMIQLPEHCSKGCDILGNGGNRKIFKSTQSDSLLSTIATAPKTGVDDLLPSGFTRLRWRRLCRETMPYYPQPQRCSHTPSRSQVPRDATAEEIQLAVTLALRNGE